MNEWFCSNIELELEFAKVIILVMTMVKKKWFKQIIIIQTSAKQNFITFTFSAH